MSLVLIVDDDNSVRLYLEMIMLQGGYTLRSLTSGVQALEYLGSSVQKPDLIVSDHNMPGITGMELLQNIRKNPALIGIPFVLMTGGKDIEEQEARKAGCSGFLTKPFPVEQLEELVKQLLQK